MTPLFTEKGYWQGEPATFTACIVRLIESPENPLWWQNAFAGMDVQALEITQGKETWKIANHDGTGYYKVTQGMGGPRCGHASFADHELVKYIAQGDVIRVIDHALIKQNDELVNAYQKEKDPIAYERIQAIKAHMDKFSKMTPGEQCADINSRMVKPASPNRKLNSSLKKDGNGKR